MSAEKSEIHTLRREVTELSEEIRENITALGGALLESPASADGNSKLIKAIASGQKIENSIKSYLTKIEEIEEIKEKIKDLSAEIKDDTKKKEKYCDDMGIVYISIGRDALAHYKETGQSTVATDKYYKEIIREQDKLNSLKEKMSDQASEPEKNIISVLLKKSKVTFTDTRIKGVDNLIVNLFKKSGAEFSETNLFDELIDNGKIHEIEKYKILKENIFTIDTHLTKAKEERENLNTRSRTLYGVKGFTVALLEINKELNLLKTQYEDSLSEIGSLFLKSSNKGDSRIENLRSGIVKIEKEKALKQKLFDKLLAEEEINSLSKQKDKIEKKISGVETLLDKHKNELKSLKKEIVELDKIVIEKRNIIEKNS